MRRPDEITQDARSHANVGKFDGLTITLDEAQQWMNRAVVLLDEAADMIDYQRKTFREETQKTTAAFSKLQDALRDLGLVP